MLSLVVVLPHPPLLVPELAAGAAAETAELRAAVRSAAARLAGAAPDWIAVGADAAGRRTVPPATAGTFAGFGRDIRVALGPGAGETDPDLPLPLLVAGWAAGETDAEPRIRGELVADDAPTADCLQLGRELAAEAEAAPGPVGLLIVGDGAATHTDKAPGHLDERAAPFDAGVAKALEHGDPAPLAALDPDLAAELWAAGRAPWQVLAGAAEGRDWRGELLYSAVPYGVAYHVAVWTPA
ncbi:class III extradiol dioxygenase subunit B-like domain-containing protein [Pseudonocardia yuanmonensis]|uniref:Class III extradiol dioxygenase subunit B-like domain-containing protein n=1 Tax=Pseudonocardia yuanmonensis TaxID=1095914 RepID=A0ABP8XIK4_9PSEU